MSATLYVIMPILAQTFGLSSVQIGILRSVNNGAMALFEILSGVLDERVGERKPLVFGLICAGLGYVGLVAADIIWVIAICLFVIDLGGAFQHALCSSIVSKTFEDNGCRSALGFYNSSGDVGKLAFTVLFSLATAVGISWQGVSGAMGGVALTVAVAVFLTLLTL